MVTLALLQQGGQDGTLENGNCSEIGCILFHYKAVLLVCWLKLAVRVVWNPRQLAEESGGNKIISQLRKTQNNTEELVWATHDNVSRDGVPAVPSLPKSCGSLAETGWQCPCDTGILSDLLYKKLIWTKGKLLAHSKTNEGGIVSEHHNLQPLTPKLTGCCIQGRSAVNATSERILLTFTVQSLMISPSGKACITIHHYHISFVSFIHLFFKQAKSKPTCKCS